LATITLDVATLLALLAIDSAVFTVLVFATVWNRLGEGRREWIAALGLQTLSWTLLALGPEWLPEAALEAALVINRIGLAFYALAMARLAGRPLHLVWYVAPPLVLALLRSPLADAWALRAMASDFIVLFLFALCILPLLRADKDLSRTSRWIVIASFALGAASIVGRLLAGEAADDEFSRLFAETRANAARLMLVHLNIIFGNVGIALLYRERAAAKLSRQSHLDPLTELFNRASFLEQAARELQRAARAGRPATALVINLEAFKQINQRYGQLAGDRVLRHFSRLLVMALRAEDLCARWSGASFSVLLTDSDRDGAERLVQRLDDAVSAAHVEPDGISYRIGIGVATAVRGEAEAFELFSRAEAALGDAKQATASAPVAEAGAAR
jgi:diguanylate cyclase (GGDEF)-like protein